MSAECLDLTVSSRRPVPVVDGDGRLAGILSPRAMMRGLIGTGDFDPHRNGGPRPKEAGRAGSYPAVSGASEAVSPPSGP